MTPTNICDSVYFKKANSDKIPLENEKQLGKK